MDYIKAYTWHRYCIGYNQRIISRCVADNQGKRSGCDPNEGKGSPMAGSSFHYDNQNDSELQRIESMTNVIRTLFRDIWMTLGCFTYLMVLFAN